MRVSPRRRGQRCSRASAESLHSRAPGALGSEGSRREEFRRQGAALEASAAVLPTGDFSTCRRRRSEAVAGAGGRSGFPKSPFTSLIRVTRPRCAARNPRGSPFLGKGKVSLLQAAERPGLEPAPEKRSREPRQPWKREGARERATAFPCQPPFWPRLLGAPREEMLMWSQCPLPRAPRLCPTRP